MRICLIIGNATNFREDIKKVRSLPIKINYTIAVKRTLYQYGGEIDAFATLHPEMAQDHINQRFAAGFDMRFDTYTSKFFKLGGLDSGQLGIKEILVYPEDWGGSSGLYAVQVATKLLQFDRVILAGMPMDEQPRFGDEGRWAPSDRGIKRYREAWEKHLPKYESKVRSLSGWTKTLLGYPDRHWLGLETLEKTHGAESNT